jgi:uncharacterized membrane protein
MKNYNKIVFKKTLKIIGLSILSLVIVGLCALNLYTTIGLIVLFSIVCFVWAIIDEVKADMEIEEIDNCDANNNGFYEINTETGKIEYKQI